MFSKCRGYNFSSAKKCINFSEQVVFAHGAAAVVVYNIMPHICISEDDPHFNNVLHGMHTNVSPSRLLTPVSNPLYDTTVVVVDVQFTTAHSLLLLHIEHRQHDESKLLRGSQNAARTDDCIYNSSALLSFNFRRRS